MEKGQDPEISEYFGARELPVNAALGNVDYYELMCIWTDEHVSASVWYRLLNLGFLVPASAGTDAMTNYWRAPAIGTVRVYVQSPAPLSYEGWIDGLKKGRSFVTSGPLLTFTVNGRGPGDKLQFPSGGQTSVDVEAEAVSIVPMERLEIVQNGEVVFSEAASDPRHVRLKTRVPVARSGWIAARVIGPGAQHLTMNKYVYAHSNPVRLMRGTEAPSSPADARYFLTWIDRVMALMEERNTFYTPEEKEAVFAVWRKGREVYAELAKRTPPSQ